MFQHWAPLLLRSSLGNCLSVSVFISSWVFIFKRWTLNPFVDISVSLLLDVVLDQSVLLSIEEELDFSTLRSPPVVGDS